ncbi:MAG: maleylpyruvate isomerase family mycothiol-dependent enzyme [Actinomycetota bacterium]|nr:maleylpyruvate isomerase family mycothiol-dependent enzyme [Actinomycetota bacterium]
MTDQQTLQQYVETWHLACADFAGLAREIPEEQWGLATDLPGWSVKDVVAHIAHLEFVMAGGAEEPGDETARTGPGSRSAHYTERGVAARRGRTMPELVDEIEAAVEQRYAELRAQPPTDPDAAAARTPGGIGWDTATLLSNRPIDVWMHEQDIRRAIDRPGGFDSPAAAHAVGVFLRALPMVVGKRVAPPAGTSVHVTIPDAGVRSTVRVGEDGRATPTPESTDPDTALSMNSEAFVILAGGRRRPDQVEVQIAGDADLGARVLESLAVTP